MSSGGQRHWSEWVDQQQKARREDTWLLAVALRWRLGLPANAMNDQVIDTVTALLADLEAADAELAALREENARLLQFMRRIPARGAPGGA